jgi:hypothetical protein
VVQALAQPRLHDQLVPATVGFEWTGLNIQGYDIRTVSYLKSLGANVSWIAPGQSTKVWIKSYGTALVKPPIGIVTAFANY